MTAGSSGQEAKRGNLIYLGLSQAFRLGAGFAINIMVMRWVGVEGFGVYGYITTLVGLLSFGAYMGLDRLLNGEISRREDLAGRYVSGGLLATLLLSSLTAAIIIGWTAWMDGRPDVVLAASLGALALGLRSVAMIPVAAFHAVRRMGLGTTAHMIGRTVLVAATAMLLWSGLDVEGVFVAQVLDGAVTLGLILFVYSRTLGGLSLRQGIESAPGLLRRSVTFGMNALYTSVYLSVDVLMLQQMHGEAEVGIYRAAAVVISLLPQVADTITTGIFPRMARHLGQPLAAGEELSFTTRVLLAIGVPATIGGLMLAEPLVVLMGGEDFASAALPFMIMAPMLPIRFLTNAYGMTLTSLDRQGERTRGTLYAAVVNILLNLAIIPVWGVEGAAATTLATDILLVSWLRWRVGPLVQEYRIGGMLLRTGVPAILMGGALWLLPPLPVLLSITIGAAVYAVAGYLSGAWHPRDLSRLRRV